LPLRRDQSRVDERSDETADEAPVTGVHIVSRAFVLAAAIASLAAVAAGIAPSASLTRAICGGDRRNVALLLDAAARRIDFAPRPATVEALRALSRPPRVNSTSPRLTPIEFHIYRLHVRLVAVTRTASLDAVLAVRGQHAGSTMLIVFPDTHTCLPMPGPHGGDIHSATDGLYADCGPSIPSGRWVPLRGTADIEGVAFWQPQRRTPTKWAAPNGLTLHPALSFYAHGCSRAGALR
jgi:hypothetical protein